MRDPTHRKEPDEWGYLRQGYLIRLFCFGCLGWIEQGVDRTYIERSQASCEVPPGKGGIEAIGAHGDVVKTGVAGLNSVGSGLIELVDNMPKCVQRLYCLICKFVNININCQSQQNKLCCEGGKASFQKKAKKPSQGNDDECVHTVGLHIQKNGTKLIQNERHT